VTKKNRELTDLFELILKAEKIFRSGKLGIEGTSGRYDWLRTSGEPNGTPKFLMGPRERDLSRIRVTDGRKPYPRSGPGLPRRNST